MHIFKWRLNNIFYVLITVKISVFKQNLNNENIYVAYNLNNFQTFYAAFDT